ncbi:F-box protein SKIP22-like [Rosa rugosa]|uniref:F-box protein SKIP22-like n=1 Tax=Rosa rugosa TaxID=74645 RepID=UPI002B40979F|nr:F-box protein SKIP22-like [Rosa rugosa]
MAFELGQRTPMGEEDEERACDPLKDDKYKYSPSLLLRRVLTEELAAQDLHRNHKNNKLLVAAVHAVLLDSGFVRFSSGTSVLDALLELGFTEFGSVSGMSHSYTLPEILIEQDNCDCSSNRKMEGIVLKFENLGNFSSDQKRTKHVAPRMVKVSGSLINSGSRFGQKHKKVCLELDENKFAPAIEFFWGNNTRNTVNDLGFRERQVCEFWKIVKDEIALPLLIDLCAEAGLPAPLCLMSLPPELKMKILEAMPGADLAKVGGVCKELRDLANDNELWKHKLAQEFSGTREVVELWKVTFHRQWETKKEQAKKLVGKKRGRDSRENVYCFDWQPRPKYPKWSHEPYFL